MNTQETKQPAHVVRGFSEAALQKQPVPHLHGALARRNLLGANIGDIGSRKMIFECSHLFQGNRFQIRNLVERRRRLLKSHKYLLKVKLFLY